MNDAPAQPEQPGQPTPTQPSPDSNTPQAPSVTPPVQPSPGQTSTGTPDESPLTTETGKKNKFLKPALIVLGVVIVITISELGYFLYTKSGFRKPATEKQLPVTPVRLPSPVISPGVSPFQAPEMVPSKNINVDRARAFAQNLESFKGYEELFNGLTINYNVSGTVTTTSFDQVEIGGVNYVYLIELASQNGQRIGLRYTSEEITQATVLVIKSEGKEEINLTDIQANDSVTIRGAIDLLDLSPLTRLTFEVIKGGE